MVKKLGLIFIWFFLTPVVLAASLFYFYQQNKINQFVKTSIAEQTPQENQGSVDGQVLGVKITDPRPYVVANFLGKTALEPYSEYMVTAADKYSIDWRLIPAIAMKESTGGNAAPAGSFNAWGVDNGRTQFDSWEGAIDSVAKTLKEKYINKGLATPEEIMAVYAPPQLLNGGKWAKDINLFFARMESSKL